MMNRLRIDWLLACLVLSVANVGCNHARSQGGDPAASGAVPRNEIAMLEFRFRPDSLNVWTGDTVTWINRGSFPHTTTSGSDGKPDGLWDTKHLARGESFSYVFTRAGTYRYFCRPHNGLGMKGVVVVSNR
jgi:manganese oxidase